MLGSLNFVKQFILYYDKIADSNMTLQEHFLKHEMTKNKITHKFGNGKMLKKSAIFGIVLLSLLLFIPSNVLSNSPTDIVAFDAETDETNGFTELDGARYVATFTISDTTYAIVASDSDDGVQIINLSDPTNIITSATTTTNTGGGSGCAVDCEEPTLGVDSTGKRLVTNGFTYNGKSVDVETFFTPYPLITADVGKQNKAEFKIYENQGPENIRHFSFAFGLLEKHYACFTALLLLVNREKLLLHLQ